MKIAIFVDGKNFYMGFQRHAAGRRLNFPRLATWLKDQAGGSLLVGCHYYTGIENNERGASLLGFLAMLETQRGYFVHRFPRKTESFQCSNCGEAHVFTREKEVDTTMVADMLRMAAVDAFDALVLVSGDADHAPAVEGVRALGRQAYVATWGGIGLSRRIRRAAFDHIDLVESLSECGRQWPVGEGEENTAPILVPGQGPTTVSPGSLPMISGSEDERSTGST